MLSSLFDSSTVLQQVVSFTQARHGVLAGNVANIDTPGYKTRDLSPQEFQEKLSEAIEYRDRAARSPSYSMSTERTIAGRDGMNKVRESMKNILYHDNSNVSIEEQVAELSKNQGQHNLALSLMTAQFRLIRAAVSERV